MSLVLPLLTLLSLTACVAPPTEREEAALPLPDFQAAVPRPVAPLPATLPLEPARVQLGKELFRDPRLSGDGTIACATCHDLHRGGSDYGHKVSTGIGGQQGSVRTPTVFNSGFNLAQFWDGRAATLEEQIEETLQNPREMGASLSEVRRRLARDTGLVDRFEEAYREGLVERSIVDALATYVRALITPGSPFDRFLLGDSAALDEEARAGFGLFMSLGCVSCHQGRNLGGNLFQRFGVMGDYFTDRGNVTEADLGRYNVTGRKQDRFRFKVPTLRNVADRPPYFHDGSAETLAEAVRIMVRYQLGRPAREDEVEMLVTFLESLSGELDESLL